jgi:integrase
MMTNTNKKNNYLFRPELKSAFLEEGDFSQGTIKNYIRIFSKVSEYEKELDKDISQFSFEELEKILYGFEANNRHTVETYGRVISSYLHWCVQKGIAQENQLEKIKSNDFDRYIKAKETYITEKQLRRYEDLCANYQDAVILRLLYIGVGGKQHSEISNLKVTDVDWDRKQLRLVNSLQVDDRGRPKKSTERFIPVDNRTLNLIKGAIEQKSYIKRNGFMTIPEKDNVREYTDLIQNDYVVRASATKNSDPLAPVDKFVIHRRLTVLAETLDIDYLKPKYLQRSGMIYLAHSLIGRDEEVTLDDLKIIADRFNIKSYHNLKAIITTKTVRETYPEEFHE